MLICMNTILIEGAVWSKVDTILKVRVSQHFMNDQLGVTIEDLMDIRYPLWSRRIAVVAVHASISDLKALPGNLPNRAAINCCIKFVMVSKWYLPARTYLEEAVDIPLRHLSLPVCQLCHFEPLLALKRSPIS